MQRIAFWSARGAGYVVVGLLTLLGRPSGPLAGPVQAVSFGVVGLGLAVWALIDLRPSAARYRGRWLPVIFGVIATAAGLGAAIGSGGNVMVAYGIVATMAAGTETDIFIASSITAMGVLAIEVGGVVYSQGVGTFLGLPLLLIVGLLIGRNRGAVQIQAEQSAALLAQYEQLREEQRRADVLDERARIAREIHDVLAHSLGALGIQIQTARVLLTDLEDRDRAVEALVTAQRMAADGLVETRRAVHALRVDTLPLHEELARAAESYARRHDTVVAFDTGGVPRPLPPDATIALLRAAQEALVNAIKHAEGQRVAVRLDYGDEEVRLTIRNDLAAGHAVGPIRVGTSLGTVNGGYGLTGMQERLRLLNGTLEAGPQDGEWVVAAHLPLAAGPRSDNVAP